MKKIKNRLHNFLTKYDLLSSAQYGFHSHKSTQDAMNVLTNTIYQNIDEGTTTISVFIDLKKAFDLVDHSVLLTTLQHMELRDAACGLFENYLTNETKKSEYET